MITAALIYLVGFWITFFGMAIWSWYDEDLRTSGPIATFVAAIWPISVPLMLTIKILEYLWLLICVFLSWLNDMYERVQNFRR